MSRGNGPDDLDARLMMISLMTVRRSRHRHWEQPIGAAAAGRSLIFGFISSAMPSFCESR